MATVPSRIEISKKFLDLLARKRALKIAPSLDQQFTFKSGRKSVNFVNVGSLTDGDALQTLKWAYASFVKSLLDSGELEDFDIVFGPSYKGIPLAAIACEGLYELYGINKHFLYDRKESKGYGDKTSDEFFVGAGTFKPGMKILMVDDVITTGGAKIDSFEKLDKLGPHKIVGIVVAVDRQEKMGDAENVDALSATQAIERDYQVKTFAFLPMTSIFELVKKDLKPEIRQAWVEYYEKYGAVELK